MCVGAGDYCTIFPFLTHFDVHKRDLKLAANVSNEFFFVHLSMSCTKYKMYIYVYMVYVLLYRLLKIRSKYCATSCSMNIEYLTAMLLTKL